MADSTPGHDSCDALRFDVALQRVNLLLDHVSLGEAKHCNDSKFHQEVNEGSEDDEIVKAALQVFDFI